MERRILPIIGKSGFGKTYLARSLLVSELRVFVLDLRGDYHGAKFPQGLPFWDFGDMADYAEGRRFFHCSWQGDPSYIDPICQLAMALGDTAVVIEECDRIPCEGWLREAVYRGRDPARVSLWALSQRPHLISVDLRSQMNELYVFNCSEPGALDWLRQFFSGEVLDEIPDLPVKHGWHYRIGDGPAVVERFRLP